MSYPLIIIFQMLIFFRFISTSYSFVNVSGVTTFANDTLSGMPLLTILILAGNPLTLVQKPVGEMLRWLDLSDCQINYLTPDSLEYLPNLEELCLANNPRLVFSTR